MTRPRTAFLTVLVAAMAGALIPVASATAALPKGDVVFVLDESGSMGDEIADVRANIASIAAEASDRIDARYALVAFGGGAPDFAVNEPFTRTDFTTTAGLRAALQHSGAFPGNGGGYEMGLDATTYAMTKLTGFRADAAACAVIISDEAPSFRTDEATDLRGATAALAARNAIWFGVVDAADPIVRRTYGPDPGSLAASTRGATFTIGAFRRDPSAILTAILASCAHADQQPRPAGPTEAAPPTHATPKCTIRGTWGPDVLRGTAGPDVICGFGGDDVIRARGGDDTVRGGAGNDTIIGGAGNDVVDGQQGADRMSGGRGNDVLSGGGGRDVVRGQQGADRMSGGRGNDVLSAGSGRDVVRGQQDADRLYGGSGRDTLSGGRAQDVLMAADGQRDSMDGGPGADFGVVDRRLDRVRSIQRTISKPRR
jgi:hypothetical protein